MVNQSVIDSSVNLEQLKDIEDLIPNICLLYTSFSDIYGVSFVDYRLHE